LSAPLPLPSAQPEDVLVKLVGKFFRPCCQLLAEESIQQRLQGVLVANFLVSGRLIDQARDAGPRQAFHDDMGLVGYVRLLWSQRAVAVGLDEDVTDFGQKLVGVAVCAASALQGTKLDLARRHLKTLRDVGL